MRPPQTLQRLLIFGAIYDEDNLPFERQRLAQEIQHGSITSVFYVPVKDRKIKSAGSHRSPQRISGAVPLAVITSQFEGAIQRRTRIRIKLKSNYSHCSASQCFKIKPVLIQAHL